MLAPLLSMNFVKTSFVHSTDEMKVRWIDSKSRQSREVRIDLMAILSRAKLETPVQTRQAKLIAPECSMLDVLERAKRFQTPKTERPVSDATSQHRNHLDEASQ